MQMFSSEVKQAKHSFVKEHLSPLLRAIDADIQEARYQIGATLEEVSYQHIPSPISEYVIIVYENGHTKGVDVSANSHLSICRDVLKALN